MPALNYTTKIPVDRTVAECQAMLGKHGASHVAVAYEDGSPSGLAFALTTPHGQRSFTLPVDVAAVHALLLEQKKTGAFKNHKQGALQLTSREHAARVSWRVAKDWLEASLAIIEAGMASLDQVMLPYLNVGPDRTLYDAYKANEQRVLEAGAG